MNLPPGAPADVGAADPALVAALESGEPQRILALLEGARLLVAVIAMPGSEHASEGEMALAMLESARGERALPAFTSLEALRSWNGEGRPVPRAATEIVAYALAESLSAVVIDPGAAHSWILWRDAFASDRPEASEAGGYSAPSWRPSRRARKSSAPYEVFAVDAPVGTPAVAVICPDGTLDTEWARRLLTGCPAGTGLIAVAPGERLRLLTIGRPF